MDTQHVSVSPENVSSKNKTDGNGFTVIPFVFPGVPGVRCAFGTALTGSLSLVTASSESEQEAARLARKQFLHALGLKAWSELQQVHGDLCLEAVPTNPDSFPDIEADGLHTDKAGLGLAIKTADCQPILLADSNGSAIAALHVGWRGNVINFPASGVQAFCKAYSLMPSEVFAVRGPSLGPSEAEFINFGEEWGPEFLPWFDAARRTMDLWTLTRHQLTEAGVLPQHIFSIDLCTKSLPELFFSFRRLHSGRQVSVIWKE